MFNPFKSKRGLKLNDEETAKLLSLITVTYREMAWFEIENNGQQQTRDYLVGELLSMEKALHKKWLG